jgi:hypothetical protein
MKTQVKRPWVKTAEEMGMKELTEAEIAEQSSKATSEYLRQRGQSQLVVDRNWHPLMREYFVRYCQLAGRS